MSLYKVPFPRFIKGGMNIVDLLGTVSFANSYNTMVALKSYLLYHIISNKHILWVYVQLSRDLALFCIAGNFFNGDHKCLRTVQVGPINYYCSLLLAPSGALIAIPAYNWYSTQPLFQITSVLNTGLSLSEPLQLYQGQSLDLSANSWIPYGYNRTSLQGSAR